MTIPLFGGNHAEQFTVTKHVFQFVQQCMACFELGGQGGEGVSRCFKRSLNNRTRSWNLGQLTLSALKEDELLQAVWATRPEASYRKLASTGHYPLQGIEGFKVAIKSIEFKGCDFATALILVDYHMPAILYLLIFVAF